MDNIISIFQDFFDTLLAGMTGTIALLFYIAAIVAGVALVFLFRFYIAYRMAKNRHRDPLGWSLLSLLVSPLLTWILLLIVGDID